MKRVNEELYYKIIRENENTIEDYGVPCFKCKKIKELSDVRSLTCEHYWCINCLKKSMEDTYGMPIKCKCGGLIENQMLRNVDFSLYQKYFKTLKKS